MIDPWTGAIWFVIFAVAGAGLFLLAYVLLRGRWRWVLVPPALVALLILVLMLDSLVLAPRRWQEHGVCSGWWKAVPTYLPDGSYNQAPDLCVSPM